MNSTDVRSTALRRKAVKTVVECEEYWKRCRVPPFLTQELVIELESHLEGAISDGKKPEAISRPKEWARTQARDCSTPQSLKDRILDWACLLLSIGAIFTALLHVLQWTPAFRIGIRGFALIACMAAATKLLSSPKASFVVFNPLHRKGLIAYGDYWGICAGLILSSIIPLESVTEVKSIYIEWSWPYSLVLLVGALFLEVLIRRRSRDPWITSTPDMGRPPGLALVDDAYLQRKRELERLALRWSIFSTGSTGLGWWIAPGEAHWIMELVFALSICWLLYLLYTEFTRRSSGGCASV